MADKKNKKEEKKVAYKPSDEDKKTIIKVEGRFVQMKKAKADLNLEKDWDKCDKLYFPQKVNRKDTSDWQSKLHNPQVFAYVNTAVSMLIDQKPEIILEARRSQDRFKEDVLVAIHDYTWEKGKGDLELFYTIMSAGMYGTGIGFEGYRSEEREISEEVSFDEETQKREYKKKTIKKEDVYWRNVDVRQFYIDEMATSLSDAIDCGERFVYSLDAFKAKYSEKRYPNAKYVTAGGEIEEKSEMKYHPDVGNDKVEVWHYYNEPEDKFIIWANGVILQDTPIPYKHKRLPYARLLFFPRSRSSFWGMGLPEVLENHSDQLDTIINMRIDQAKLSIDKSFLIGGGEMIDEQDLRLKPGGFIPVNDINNIKPIEFTDIKSSAYKEDALIMDSMKYATGIDPRMEAVSQSGTATEAAIVKESSLRRIKIVLRLLEQEFLTDLATMRIANIQQFYSLPLKVKKVIGEDGVEKYDTKYRTLRLNLKKVIVNDQVVYQKTDEKNFFDVTPEDIRGSFDIKIKPMSTIPVSQALEKQQANDAYIQFSANPHIDLRKFTEWSLRKNYIPLDVMAEEQGQGAGLIALAEQENMKMAETGEPIPSTEGATPEHTAIHDAFMKSPTFQSLQPQIQQAFQQHVAGEKGAQTGGENTQGTLPNDYGKSPQRVSVNQGAGAPMNRATL